ALVTGGNRGIGLEVCRELGRQGYRVVFAGRDLKLAERAAADLATGEIVPHQLDVTDPRSIARLERELDRVDVLINNAAVYLDEGRSVLEVEPEVFRVTYETNLIGPLALCQAFLPGMIERGYGRVVNVSSGAGEFGSMRDDTPAYRVSKAALNALTLILADAARRAPDVLVNAVCPGWVKTRMGGSAAPRTPEQGADTIVWLATHPAGGPTGGFFRNRKPIPW
ncbi:MAG TPA: SDR family oxidoreductase, partial [Candidatus Udaeobacter sp.]|nr:SDR family oxidoreductase [Candidatus Udaeobacter sp.]